MVTTNLVIGVLMQDCGISIANTLSILLKFVNG